MMDYSEEYKYIAGRMLAAMEEQRVSYGELAARTGIPKSALQRYATGGTEKIPLDRIERIAGALGMRAAAMMGWENTPWEKEEVPDQELIRLLTQLKPEEIPVVTAFLKGIQASRQKREGEEI